MLITNTKGYSKQNLYRMSQFASEFSYNEIFSQPGGQIPWRTLIEIMHKSSNHNEIILMKSSIVL